MQSLIVGVMALLLVAPSAHADTLDAPRVLFATRPHRDPWRIDWLSLSRAGAPPAARSLARSADLAQQPDDQPLHAAAIEHSEAYQTRAKIHKYASVATLPLFAAELALGQALYNTPANAGGKRAAHGVVGAGIIGLVGVNTVTGAWNMFGEGRQEKEGRTLRLVHGLLMMAADVGFLETWATGPHSGRLRTALRFESDKVAHRNIAIASISVGTAGYLLMLFGNH
jgi:hypothetical protein